MGSSPLPVSVQSRLSHPQGVSRLQSLSTRLALLRNIVFILFLLRWSRKSFYFVRGHGPIGSLVITYLALRKYGYTLFFKLPGVRSQIDQQLSTAVADIEAKLVPNDPSITRYKVLPKDPWPTEQVSAELSKLSEMHHTRWEDGRVSGAVYHGGQGLLKIQAEALERFGVANPIHPDVFPGVRKMEAEVVSMVLALFNAPSEGAGTMTSGGTESILMACYAARQRGYKERGITEPEMIVPLTVHAAFNKAAEYFKIKLHVAPCPAPSYRVSINRVRRLINPNTVLIVGSAPNYPYGVVDEIPALSRLALAYNLNLHVDCCLGSFLMPYLKHAGFASPWEEEGGFDFRLPGVTSISVDTHKYGFAPKGSSVVLYRAAKYRTYQYFVAPDWPGGVYGSPTTAGSRPGALIAGCWASLMAVGESGYIESCHKIVGTAKTIENAIREHPSLRSTLRILGKPEVSVVAFESVDPAVYLYDIADGMSARGWHLNALQDPPGIHAAVTMPMVQSAQQLISALVATVDDLKQKALDEVKSGKVVEKKRGKASALYGVAGSIPDRSVVTRLTHGFLDTLYKA